jgi:hypothetical protein
MQIAITFTVTRGSRDFTEVDYGDDTSTKGEPPSTKEAALVQRAIKVTGWQVTEPGSVRQRDALALHEVRVIGEYRPRLLRIADASQIRHEVMRVLVQTEKKGEQEDSVPSGEAVFWDGIVFREHSE